MRRKALALAAELSFAEVAAGNLGLVVTEAAKNVLKHAGGGEFILGALTWEGGAGIELLALDKGPGIADLGRCLRDGYSTAGTPGTGLGAIVRLANVYGVYSRPGQGTALMAQVWTRGEGPPARYHSGGVAIPMAGEEECGDAWAVQENGRGVRLTMADGLGHGVHAADAARAAVRAARDRADDLPPALLERIHGALRATRGAAVAVAAIDPSAGLLRFSGVGNIAGVIVPRSGPVRRLVSNAGTAGHQALKILEFTYPWDAQCLLVMHSDGLQTHWSLDAYPGLVERHPSLIAGVLYRDHARGRDDVSVVAVREIRLEP